MGSSSMRTVRQHGEGLAGGIKASGARHFIAVEGSSF